MKRCPTCQRTYDDVAAFCSADATTLVAATDPTPVGRVVGHRYRIERLLGKGGMGSVYEATQLEIGRRVALKLLNRELLTDPQAIERFRREAKAAGRLQHPNAVTIYDFGIEDTGEAYLAMEYLDGPTLRDELVRRGAFNPPDTASILHQVAMAVSAAHAEGIIHRDLKPDNVMIVVRGGTAIVKVLDFGIAKLATKDNAPGTLTGTGAIGTPYYMSPEQGDGRNLDARSDIYALGIIAFEMLTGRVPFTAPTPIATVVKHLSTPPPRPSEFVASLAGPVEETVLRALEKDPANRQQTAEEFAQELLAAATGARVSGSKTISVSPATVAIHTRPTAPAPLSLDIRSLPRTDITVPEPEEEQSRLGAGVAIVAFFGVTLILLLIGAGAAYMYWPVQTPGVYQPPVSDGARGPQPIVPSPAKVTPPATSNTTTTNAAQTSEQPGTPGAVASSTRPGQGGNSFAAANAFDGKLETAWCEGVDGEGTGESLTFNLEKPAVVEAVRIAPGYFKSQDRWTNNNRIARVQIELSNGRSEFRDLADSMEYQTVKLPASDPVKWVRVVIVRVYPGGDKKDTLISEVELMTR